MMIEASSSEDEVADDIPTFFLPSVTDPNITERDTGYNPWMKQYTGINTFTESQSLDEPTFVLMTGGCLPLEEGGSDFYQDAGTGFRYYCDQLGIQCQCRPIISPLKWNPPMNDTSIFGGYNECVWEIQRLLNEHQAGLIKVGGISAKCSYGIPEVKIFEQARALNVSLFLMGVNKPYPNEKEALLDQPTGFIGTDQAFLGREMARLLKKLRPEGTTYAFVTNWDSTGMTRRRLGFEEEISKDNMREDKPHYYQISHYPYPRYDTPWSGCHYMDCQMESLVNGTINPPPDAIIFLFQSPLRHENYTKWVDTYIRPQNITLIAMDALSYLHYLSQDYVDGLVGQTTYEMGKRSAEVLSEIWYKGLDTTQSGGNSVGEVILPPDTHLFETRLVVYNKIPLELDKLYPIEFDQNLLGSLKVVGLVCYGVVILTAILCGIWTLWKKDSSVVVKAAQPFFLFILLGGVIVFASTIIPLSFDDTAATGIPAIEDDEETTTRKNDSFYVGVCMSQPWLAFSGFSIIFSALFSKTYRVNKLFHSRRSSYERIQVSTTQVLLPFLCIFTCNVVILICWTILDPLTYERLIGDGTDFWNREIESYGACRSDKALAFLTPLALINFMVLGIACWQAFEGRNIESEFSESKYIGLSVLSLFQGFIIGIPILVVVKDEPRPFYLVLTLTIFVLSEAILLLIFLPKMRLAYEYSFMSEAEQKQSISASIHTSSNHGGNVSRHGNNSSIQEGCDTKNKGSIVTASKFFRDRAESAIAKMSDDQQQDPNNMVISSQIAERGNSSTRGSDSITQRVSDYQNNSEQNSTDDSVVQKGENELSEKESEVSTRMEGEEVSGSSKDVGKAVVSM